MTAPSTVWVRDPQVLNAALHARERLASLPLAPRTEKPGVLAGGAQPAPAAPPAALLA
jgi:hypothetical protein